MNPELKETLIKLADKYETRAFLTADPSQFMHRFEAKADIETAAFISANLAFGRRDQILKKINFILDSMNKDGKLPAQWIRDKAWKKYFSDTTDSFYRMYTWHDMNVFFEELYGILNQAQDLGTFFEQRWIQALNSRKSSERIYLHSVIADAFPQSGGIVSHSKNAAAKKLNMFLRWMVRDNSPVDMGLWNWFNKKDLLMPLDTHVMQQSVKFGFIPASASGKIPGATLKTAVALTQVMMEAFEQDPVRADFALFGLGVETDHL